MERIYNKLVRDYIPDVIIAKGETPVTKILDNDTYRVALEKKLMEEYNEVLNAVGEDRIEELADMVEIIKALAKLEHKTLQDVIDCSNEKAKKRGGFDKKIFLEKVIEKN